MKENPFRLSLTKALKAVYGSRIYIQKNHGSAFSAGLPDLQVCCKYDTPHLATWWSWELKATDRHGLLRSDVTKLQWHTMQQIADAGGNARSQSGRRFRRWPDDPRDL